MFWRRRKQEDFSQEIKSHLALETDRLREQGLSRQEAETVARREFGNVTIAQERFYLAGRWLWWEHLKRDIVYAGRVLAHNPGFTLVAVLSLALGIGANSLVFSVVNALVLRPLPVEHPEQLLFLETSNAGPGVSFPDYRELRDRNRAFAGLVGCRVAPMELDSNEGADHIWGYLATGNYFDVLGLQPAMGRFFHAEDDLQPGASPYAVLSYASWQQRFGGDRNIVGKTIRINRQPFTVLGVAGRSFHGTELFYWPEVWVPMMMEAQIEVGNPWLESRGTRNTWVLGRLKPGVSAAQARANLNAIATDLARQQPAYDEGLQFRVARPGLIGDAIGGPARAFAIGVMVLAGLVLLAACTNLASLLTARTADRQREIAIRLSVGASHGRVVRQMLTETLVLSLAGGAAGYGLAVLLSRGLSNWRAPLEFPVQFDVSPDWRVFFFACAISVLAGIVFGLAPAGHASQTNPNTVLKGETSSWRGAKLAPRDVLVVIQVALCFVLVAGCLLSLRGLQQALTLRLGFDPQGVTVVGFDLGMAGYSEEQGRAFQLRALEAIERMPGVSSAAYSNSVPLSIDQSQSSAFSEDLAHPRPADSVSVIYYQVSPNFFHTLGIELMAGRDFTWHDDAKSPRVALVNRTFGRQVLHTDQPVGKRFRFGTAGPLIQVIGVVEDGKYQTLTERPQPVVFQPILRVYNTTTTLIVKSSRPEAQMVEQMRQAVTQLDAHLPLYGAGSLQQMLGLVFFPTRAAAIALSAFGLLAIMLAATGIHGLVSYAVARRVHEIGIRMAVGARPAQVVRLVLGKVLILIIAGAAIGLALALAAGQVLASIVYQASPRDPAVFAAVLGTMALLGLASCWAPVRRALRIDPMVALRHE
jgi:predicted permease